MTTAGVIAAFNQEKYISEAVLSLAEQVDEVIVVDDASMDNTQDVLAALAVPNLIVIYNDVQLGVSRSYNRAVAASSAEILLIQGGDDRSLAGRADRQVQALSDPSVSLTYSLPRVIDARGARLPASLGSEFSVGSGGFDPLNFLFFVTNYICAPAVAVRRSDYVRVGGFRGGLDLLQDYDLWLRLASEGRFAYIDHPVVEYRKHAFNLSRDYVDLDSPKQRRVSAEMDFIRNRFLNNANEATIRRLAAHLALDLVRFDTLSNQEKVAIIQLAHGDKLQLRHGVAFLFEAAGEWDAIARFERLGLELSDLSRLAILSDHGNLEDVSRAIGGFRAADRISAKRKP
ncbi:glycosyltransferase [Cryobacterium mannosilyticum]|uniref:glycosyltransferase n=1 Tax=Cryobacterium mannosilyticum TaxID=1259190 RepID=UPI00141A951A|nr:glycosyltransferase [Cryobacterium mannosilyticum]